MYYFVCIISRVIVFSSCINNFLAVIIIDQRVCFVYIGVFLIEVKGLSLIPHNDVDLRIRVDELVFTYLKGKHSILFKELLVKLNLYFLPQKTTKVPCLLLVAINGTKNTGVKCTTKSI